MLGVRTRSGLVETIHDGALAACDPAGRLIARAGEIDRPFYLRSSAKPFQALVAQESGAALSRGQLALACASHDGEPVHLALVSRMLEEAGLDESALRCPPSWPLSARGRDLQVAGGRRRPSPLLHNCSGKHAAWLRACVANGWPLDTYLDPEHPIQERIRALVSELSGFPADPVGVDGCGAPVLRTTVAAMARAFAVLGSEARLSPVFEVMHTYPALVSGTGNGDAVIATAIAAAAKRGAAGCLGVAVSGTMGLAVKAWDGNDQVAAAAAVEGLRSLLSLTGFQSRSLQDIGLPPVLGGGEVVGHLEPGLDLVRS